MSILHLTRGVDRMRDVIEQDFSLKGDSLDQHTGRHRDATSAFAVTYNF
jgi:hypothetical protein